VLTFISDTVSTSIFITGVPGIRRATEAEETQRTLKGAITDTDIFRYEIETGIISRLTAGGNNNSAVYSLNGERIAFNSLRNNDQADLYLMRADGSDLQQITDNPEPDWQAQWEP